jgi:hypothetical protein
MTSGYAVFFVIMSQTVPFSRQLFDTKCILIFPATFLCPEGVQPVIVTSPRILSKVLDIFVRFYPCLSLTTDFNRNPHHEISS